MSTADNNRHDDMPLDICANCGKGEDSTNSLKACTACKMVKYCNRECQIAHRPQHKKECRKRAAELHDEELFKQPPPAEDCPICFLPTPTLNLGWQYQSCCGKVICCGCLHAPLYDDQGNKVDNRKCPFCRTPWPTKEGMIKRLKKRVELDDAVAIHNLGAYYSRGLHGFPQDYEKALELFHRAAELGHADAYGSIGIVFENGRGAEVDKKKAIHYYKLAAMGGDSQARYNLGCMEANDAGNIDRALKHFMISIRSGYSESLKVMKGFYTNGDVTKDDYTEALQSYQLYLGEIKSDQRDEAAAFHEEYRYY